MRHDGVLSPVWRTHLARTIRYVRGNRVAPSTNERARIVGYLSLGYTDGAALRMVEIVSRRARRSA